MDGALHVLVVVDDDPDTALVGGQYCQPLEVVRDAGCVVGATSESALQQSSSATSTTPELFGA